MQAVLKKDIVVLLLAGALILGIGAHSFFVSGSPKKDGFPELAEIAAHQSWAFQDFSSYFQKLATAKGAPYAFDVLLRAEFPPDIDVHLLGHIVGGVLYKQQGIDGINVCTQDFRNACSHAVVIGVLLERGEGALGEISDACKKAPGGRGAYTMCFHGLGHGVLAYTDYNLEKAIAMCKSVGTAEYRNREYIECVGGAIMEMIDGVHDPIAWKKALPKYFKEADPLYPCDAQFFPEEAKPICLTYLTPHLFTAANLNLGSLDTADFTKAFSFCSTLPEGSELRDTCYGGFGKEFVTLAEGRDIRNIGLMPDSELKKVRDWCVEANDASGEIQCNENALYSLFWGGENIPDASFAFCGVARSEALRADCFNALSGQITQYLSGTLKGDSLCLRLPDAYQAQCRNKTP